MVGQARKNVFEALFKNHYCIINIDTLTFIKDNSNKYFNTILKIQHMIITILQNDLNCCIFKS